MRTAHQGVPVASLPNAQRGGFPSNMFQTASQASAQPPSAPVPSGGGYRPAPARTSAPPPNPNARPEAAAGLDGWLVDRLFGR
jgi:penicillin-binding protein 1A